MFIKYFFKSFFLNFQIMATVSFIAPLYLSFAKIILAAIYTWKNYAFDKTSFLYKFAGDLSWSFKYFVEFFFFC